MHDAYEPAPILEKLPLSIESIASYEDVLLVGTKQGHLLVYSVKSTGSETRFDVSLERSNKSFSRKPIQQLSAVPECSVLISLSDTVVSVHDLTVFNQITCVKKTAGASLFAIDLQKETSLTGDVKHTLRMCVAVRRKLQLFYWKNRDFYELQIDLSVPDIPKAMAWCKDSICVGFKRDYFLIKVESGDLKELFPTGARMEPLVTKLSEDRLALQRDDMSVFINSEGNPVLKYGLNWSDIPAIMEHHPPYILAVLPKYIEIRTISPRTLIQQIELNKPKFICKGSHVYVASSNYVWRLAPIPITRQIGQLLAQKEFELALVLANMTNEEEAEKQVRIQKIQNLYAFNLFSQHRFEESLKIFAELGTDPANVIGLYPNLLPSEFRNKLSYPDKTPDLSGGELEKGILALIEYLTQRRNELQKDLSVSKEKELVSSAIVEGSTTIKSRKQLGQIIDTTLLKCYLLTNDALVAPLLRLKDNNCHLEESERVLKKQQKWSELIILYERKGYHKKALDLLLKLSEKDSGSRSSQWAGHERTKDYLMRLGGEHIDIIFTYAKWVLQASPEDGLEIFTADTTEAEGLPRKKVLEYLEHISKDLAMPYLEHIIVTCHDQTPEFHNKLVNLYREKVQALMTEYLQQLPEGQLPAQAGKEPGELGELREKFITFLEMSDKYQPERLLTHFPLDGFYEERAILLGQLGRHEQALYIYVHLLQNTRKAELYCKKHFDKNKEGNKEVYLILLKMYLSPPDPAMMRVMSQVNVNMEPNTHQAMKLLEEHASQIDTVKALELLPTTSKVKEILVFLENVLEDRAAEKRNAQVLKGLIFQEHLMVQSQRMFYQKKKCIITEEKNCRVCRKRIGNSAFARYPNEVVVHYYCCKDPNVCPNID
ncbi:vam6/Vps39-like protein [Lingula anatina]|uniref:Vam6/Vps39-like protein n=1 Tax=Lingula anatina TaxID=7574 RepID=A0A2R2MLH7_LINAN|nr:vam6/Vps39-like protein [Lingula anatina]|eukprot:XP_023931071.1 vam6/Vps39-like protein [Lingula anatina]